MNYFSNNPYNINFLSGDSREGSLRTLFSRYSWRINDPGNDVAIAWEYLGMKMGTWRYNRNGLQTDRQLIESKVEKLFEGEHYEAELRWELYKDAQNEIKLQVEIYIDGSLRDRYLLDKDLPKNELAARKFNAGHPGHHYEILKSGVIELDLKAHDKSFSISGEIVFCEGEKRIDKDKISITYPGKRGK